MWENGKRIKWFSQEEIDEIENGCLDYFELYEKGESKIKVYAEFGFQPPPEFLYSSALEET